MATFSVKEGKPSVWQGIALGGAHGIATGLQQLAADRLANIKAQNEQQKLSQLLSQVPPQNRADLLHMLPPEQRLSGLYALGQSFAGDNQQPKPFTLSQPETAAPEPTQFAAAQDEQRRQLGLNQPQPQQISPQQLANDSLALQGGQPTQIKLKEVLDEIQSMGLPRPNKEQRNQIEGMISQFNPEQMNAQQPQPQQPPVLPSEAPKIQPQAPKKYALEGISFAKPLTAGEKIAQQKLEIDQRDEERKIYKEVKPYLDRHADDFKLADETYRVAKRMLDTLRTNKKDWPKYSGYLPDEIQRNPAVRKYVADAQKLVGLSANAAKGTPTNFKIKLEQQKKANLSQPIQTQESILEDIIRDTQRVFNTDDIIRSVKQKNEGRFPQDLAQQVIEQVGRPDQEDQQRAQAETDPLSYPQFYQEGTQYEDDNGHIYTLKNGQWS